MSAAEGAASDAGLVEEAPASLAFLISFSYIGLIWLNHHTLLRLVRGTTSA